MWKGEKASHLSLSLFDSHHPFIHYMLYQFEANQLKLPPEMIFINQMIAIIQGEKEDLFYIPWALTVEVVVMRKILHDMNTTESDMMDISWTFIFVSLQLCRYRCYLITSKSWTELLNRTSRWLLSKKIFLKSSLVIIKNNPRDDLWWRCFLK